MEKPRYQNKDGDCATEECYHVDLVQAMSLSEVDEVLLMELLEDMPPSDLLDDDVCRLGHVIQSLETEIGGGAVAAMEVVGTAGPLSDNGGRFRDMLSYLDDYEGGSFGFWPEMPLAGHEVEGCNMYADGCEGSIVGYEVIDHQYYYAESSVEQVYIPLWE